MIMHLGVPACGIAVRAAEGSFSVSVLISSCADNHLWTASSLQATL